MEEQTGTKFDDGKLRLDLIPPEFIEMLGKIFTMGAKRYGDRNWEKGIDEGRLIAAARRHDLAHAWAEGDREEEIDRDSGVPHLAHAAWNYLAAATLNMRRVGNG